jgi:hypothetical protein
MNDAARRAVSDRLANVRDSLHRYTRLARPGDRVGGPDGLTVADMVSSLQREERQLNEALNDA